MRARLAAACLALLLGAPAVLATELPKRLVVAQSAYWKPFSFLDARGQPSGLLIDVWRAFGEANGVEIVFDLGDWQASLDSVREGRADVHGGLLFSPARDRDFDFSRGYMEITARLFLAPDIRLDTVSGLGGLQLGVVRGGYEEEYVREHYPRLALSVFPNNEALMRAALAHKVPAVVADYPVAMFYLHTLGDPEQLRVAQALYSEPLRVAVRQGNVALLEAVNQGIEALDRDTIERIQQKWLRAEPVVPRWFWSAVAVVASATLLLTLAGYALLLRHTVRARTRELAESVESLAEANARLEVLASTDALTGLLNRRAFFAAASREEQRARRHGHRLSLVVFDIDHFKRINDTHGHPAGDAALEHAARLLRAQLRETDLLARIGGEEFALLLPDTAVDGAVELAGRMLQAARMAPLVWEGQTVEVRFSAGVAALGADVDTISAAMARADAALYASKQAGRDRLTRAAD